MKKHVAVLFLLTTLLISGCGKKASSLSSSELPPVDSYEPMPSGFEGGYNQNGYLEGDMYIHVDSGVREFKQGETKVPYTLGFKYCDEYFLSPATTYNADLSMMSLGLSLATATKARGDEFFDSLEFEFYESNGYETEPTKDSVGYYVATKSIDDYELITLGIRGFNYKKEWTNNLIIGEEENHKGFEERANDIVDHLYTDYITKASKTVKLWIAGYSRAGSIAQIVADIFLDNYILDVSPDNMYVYTFEAPASLAAELSQEQYDNVHNIVNSGDLIANVIPESYGLVRCGKTYDIYDMNIDKLAKEFDSKMIIPEFKLPANVTDQFTNDAEFRRYVLNIIFNSENADDATSANTRRQYVQNYQNELSAIVGDMFSLNEDTLKELAEALKKKGLGVVTMFTDETGNSLADFFKPYFQKDNISITDNDLITNCAALAKAIKNLFLPVLTLFLSESYRPLFTRIIDFHYPEVTYLLLKNYHNKLANN